MGFGDYGCVYDGIQGGWKRATAKIGSRFGMAFVGVGWEFGVSAFLFGSVLARCSRWSDDTRGED